MDYELKQTVIDTYSWNTYFFYKEISPMVDCYSIGCELSQFDAEFIGGFLRNKVTKKTIIINVCAVTEYSFKACILLCELISKLYHNTNIYIVGCAVDYNYNKFKKYGKCLKNNEKYVISNYKDVDISQDDFDDALTYKVKNTNEKDVGFVKVQDGCPNKCAYCIVNKTRGKPYSVSYDKIKLQIASRLVSGYKKIELVGTEISYYNSDGMKISDVCDKILQDFSQLECLRLSALDPASSEIEKIIDLKDKYGDRLGNVIVLAAQSCCDKTLKEMNRHHTFDRLKYLHEYAKGRVGFSYHFITGFPNETEKDFNESFAKIRELNPIDVTPTAFSRRRGTVAFNAPNQIKPSEIRDRKNKIEEYRKTINGREDQEKLEKYASRLSYYPQKLIGTNWYDYDKDLLNIGNLYNLLTICEMQDRNLLETEFTCKIDQPLKTTLKSEVIHKFLLRCFGIRIINEKKVTNALIRKIINNPSLIKDYCLYNSCFIRFTFDNCELNKNLFMKFIEVLDRENIYNLNILLSDMKYFESKYTYLLDTYLKKKE